MVKELNVDVVVLGGAGAGLSAAIRAKENGAEKVLILEKMKTPGGATRLAQEMFAINSPVHERNGIKNDIDAYYLMHMRQSVWRPNSLLVRRWYQEQRDAYAWLEGLGQKFEEKPRACAGTTLAMVDPIGGGNAMVRTYLKRIEELGIEIMLETRAQHLIQNAEGDVVGVTAYKGDTTYAISAKSVILATGSISNNKELLDKMYPGQNYHLIKRMAGLPHNTGDGFIMAQEIGCKPAPMHTLYIGPHNHPMNMRVGNIMRRFHLININKNGKRFCNESMPVSEDWGWMKAVALDMQPEHKCYCLMDDSIYQRYKKDKKNYTKIEEKQGRIAASNQNQQAKYGTDSNWDEGIEADPTEWLNHLDEDFAECVEKGKMKICDTLEEVAAFVGCKVETLKETLDNYNKYCENGYDADFLKDPEYMWPINTAPYYVFEGLQGIDTCIGGIAIDEKMRVVDPDGEPIKNLYAAGTCTSGWCNNAYGFFGSCMSLTLYSGYVSGKEAALNAAKSAE